MPNKYLEKVAGLLGLAGTTLRTAGSVASDAVKGTLREVGTSASKAMGSGFANAAHDAGVTSQWRLRGIKEPKAFLRAVKEKGMSQDQRKILAKSLQIDKNKARMRTAIYAGAALYGGNKILNRVQNGSFSQTPSYGAYDQQYY